MSVCRYLAIPHAEIDGRHSAAREGQQHRQPLGCKPKLSQLLLQHARQVRVSVLIEALTRGSRFIVCTHVRLRTLSTWRMCVCGVLCVYVRMCMYVSTRCLCCVGELRA